MVKVILCGYHQSGAGALAHLLSRPDVTDLALFTHQPPAHVPDLRGMASRHNIYCSTESINTASLPFTPDIIASVYYRYIIKPHVIDVCQGRIFNVHPSLLPLHRGCSSVPWAIIDGDQCSGITYHYINRTVDTGNIILQRAIEIRPRETQATLYDRCISAAVDFFPAALELVKQGFAGTPQEGRTSYHTRGAPHGGAIDPKWSDDAVDRFIRAMTYPPYAPATYLGQPVLSLEDYHALRNRHVGSHSEIG